MLSTSMNSLARSVKLISSSDGETVPVSATTDLDMRRNRFPLSTHVSDVSSLAN